MSNMKDLLLCAAITVIFVTAGLASVTGSEHLLLLDDLNASAVQRPVRGVDNFNLSAFSSPCPDNAARSPGEVTAVSGSPYPVHNLNTSENFSSIQEAIDAPNTTAGHIIEVDPGNYSENINVNKSVTVRSLSGDPLTTIVQAANTSQHVFTVTADNVTIRGFSIEGAFDNGAAGISLSSAHNRITDTILTANYYGILVESEANHNLVSDSTLSSNYRYGIYLETNCGNNAILNNTLDSNIYAGIYLRSSNNNKITDNTVNYLHYYGGIRLRYSSNNNTITTNAVASNLGSGIILWDDSDNNSLTHNTVSNNDYGGIELLGTSSNNIIANNIATANSGSGITLWDDTNNNTILENFADHNEECGIALYDSSSDNKISHNELSSNNYGLSIVSADGNAINNTIIYNTMSYNKRQGIWLRNLQHPTTIKDNTASHNLIFGIGISQSTNLSIESNTANFNELGIGLLLSDDLHLIDNTVDSNRITGFYLWESYNNMIVNNTANLNQFEGVYLLNSSFNDISTNTFVSSYFGIYLYAAPNNTISNNDAASNYYTEVFLYASPGNTIINNTEYIQEDIIYGVILSVPESLTPSLQAVDNGTNATYSLMVENLGNTPDIFDLTALSDDDPVTLLLEPDSVSLGPGAIDYETIKLHVGDTAPGIYRATIEARSRGEPTVKDSIGTRTIVRGEVDSESVNSVIEDSALITATIMDSSISRSAIINATISGSTITESVITNSAVAGTTLHDVTVTDAIVTDGVISTGTLTINGITYEIDGEERIIADLVIGSDYSDSTLVGIKDSKTLTVIAEDSDVDFDISAKDDYFAGSMRVQKAVIPPNGVPKLTNAVSGYIYANVSENVANSTEKVLIKVYYDRTELGDLDESSLQLMYFDETAEVWEALPISGVNLAENYVWANISHYSVFSVSGSVTPKKPSKSGGGSASIDSDEDGLTDLQELILGTDKENPDTDGDGFLDGEDPFPLDHNLPLRSTPTPKKSPTPAPIPTTTIVSTPSPQPSTPPIPEEEKTGYEFPTPGFDALFALSGILAVAYLVLRRRR